MLKQLLCWLKTGHKQKMYIDYILIVINGKCRRLSTYQCLGCGKIEEKFHD